MAVPPSRREPARVRLADDIDQELARYRSELAGYCYRMLGSAFEAEDAVQETLVRAWRGFDRFEGRSGVRSWLYKIATNVCLDMLAGRQRRARPMDLGPAGRADDTLPEALPEGAWITPAPDEFVLPESADPAELVVLKESVRLAFVAALQHLPARQRAVLISREVLRMGAAEVAELLGTSVASVNSALQRARAALERFDAGQAAPADPTDSEQKELLERYLQAFERYDMAALTALLQQDASWSMPPYPLWLTGHEDIVKWCLGPGIGCRGSRLVPVAGNGTAMFGQYRPSPGGGYEPWSLQVIEGVRAGKITGISFFLDTQSLFPLFGLPPRLD